MEISIFSLYSSQRNNFSYSGFCNSCLKPLPTASHCNQNKIQIIFMACKTMIQLLLCPRLPSFSLVLMFQPQWSLYPSAGLYSNLELSGTPFPNNSGILSSCRSQIKCPNLREASPKYPTYRCPLSSPMSLYPTALFSSQNSVLSKLSYSLLII